MKLTLNLSSRPYVNRRMLYLVYALLGGALVLLLALNAAYAHRLRAEAEQIRSHLAELKGGTGGSPAVAEITPEALRRQQESIAFANDILRRDSFRWTRLLDHLEEAAVEGVAIRGLQPDYKERSLRVRGAARGVDEMRRYLDQLIASRHFSEVYLLEQSREEAPDAKGGAPGGGKSRGISFSILLKGAF